jgi:hypothetical protein
VQGRDPRDESFTPLDVIWMARSGRSGRARIGDVAGWSTGCVFLL